jgi:hypothetical protein
MSFLQCTSHYMSNCRHGCGTSDRNWFSFRGSAEIRWPPKLENQLRGLLWSTAVDWGRQASCVCPSGGEDYLSGRWELKWTQKNGHMHMRRTGVSDLHIVIQKNLLLLFDFVSLCLLTHSWI